MSENEQLALRASGAICEALADAQHCRLVIALPDAAWDRCRDLIRQIKKATSRQWHRAADRLREHLGRALDELRRQVDQSLYRLDTRDPTDTRATRHDVLRDLVALGDEFDRLPHLRPTVLRQLHRILLGLRGLLLFEMPESLCCLPAVPLRGVLDR